MVILHDKYILWPLKPFKHVHLAVNAKIKPHHDYTRVISQVISDRHVHYGSTVNPPTKNGCQTGSNVWCHGVRCPCPRHPACSTWTNLHGEPLTPIINLTPTPTLTAAPFSQCPAISDILPDWPY